MWILRRVCNSGPALGILLLTCWFTFAEVPSNAVFLSRSGARQPVTISRVFAKGEIPEFAQAVVENEQVPTQCDVKTRWEDGSLKHALLSFWINGSGGARVDFINQTSGNKEGALDRAGMLDFNGGQWGAALEAVAQVEPDSLPSMVINAKGMLREWDGERRANSVRYWLEGPICTQVILEDRSPHAGYDFGWKATLAPVRLANDIAVSDQEIRILNADVKELQQWRAPLTAYVESEIVQICSIDDTVLKLCPSGRGLAGTRVVRHAANRGQTLLVPDQGWRNPDDTRFKSLHPIFVLTFYPGWAGVKVEAILENVWSTRLQNLAYSLRFYRDEPLSMVRPPQYLVHYAKTRFRSVFWSGEQPPAVNVDYNLPYLTHARVLPNYDTSRSISSAAVRDAVAAFSKTDRGSFNGNAQWLKYFPTTGNRGEVGLFPIWYMQYLYSFSSDMYEVMLGNAAAGSHVPIHIRESDPLRAFHEVGGERVQAFGRPLSPVSRPNLNVLQPNMREDAVLPVGVVTNAGWTPDLAHQASFAFIPYIVTGDWYWLEELYFWAGFNVTSGNPGRCNYCRHDTWGYITSQIRGEAWGMRTLGHAAFAAVDGTAEKAFFQEMLANNIAIREGRYNITEGFSYEPCSTDPFNEVRETSRWCWGRQSVSYGLNNPLYFLDMGSGDLIENLDASKVAAGSSPWMYNYTHAVWGHLKDMGFHQITGLQETAAKNLLHQIRSPEYNPYLVDAYRMPIREKSAGAPFYASWASVRDGFMNGNVQRFNTAGSPYGYAHIARAAASFLHNINDGPLSGWEAWEFMYKNVPLVGSEDPRWWILPRLEPAAAAQARSRLPAAKLSAWQKRRPIASPPVKAVKRKSSVKTPTSSYKSSDR